MTNLQHGDRRTWIRFLARAQVALFLPASTPAHGLTQAPSQFVPGALSKRSQGQESEFEHASHSIVEVKNTRSYIQLSYTSMTIFIKQINAFANKVFPVLS
jgi:hypothetical protein